MLQEVDVPAQPIHRGGLAPWQRRRTLELIELHLRGDLRLARLATECRLSTSYYCRCFRVSFGTSVHQFVIGRRVERAKDLLLRSSLALAAIAAETGFSDQAAFSRTFAASVGTSPARWRTQHGSELRGYAGLRRQPLEIFEVRSASLHPMS